MHVGETWRLGLAACVLGALILAATLSRRQQTAGPCAVVEGPAMLPEIPEASGLAISRRTPGLLWSHNDSGNETVLFALDASGTIRGRVRVPIRTRDWEDVSAAPCPLGDCLYIADIGDNSLARRRIQVYRVPEPAPGDTQTAAPETFTVSYPDGAHNAEALFVVDAHLFVVTRDRSGGLYRSTQPLASSPDVTLERTGQLGLEAVTDAEASPDQTWVVVRTPDEVVLYRTADLIRERVVPDGLRIPIGALGEPQGEGVALDATGMLYVASEGRRWSRAGRMISLRCSLPSPP